MGGEIESQWRQAWWRKNSHLVAYVILVVAIVLAFVRAQAIANDVEAQAIARSVAHCETNNRTLAVVDLILQILAEPREGDDAGEYEERQALYERLSPLLVQEECPPPPPPPVR